MADDEEELDEGAPEPGAAASLRARPRSAEFRASAYGMAEDCIGELTPGVRLVGLTKGQFSMLDLVRAVLDQTGAADVVINTWTVGSDDVEHISWLRDVGTIRSFHLVMDASVPQRKPAYARLMTDLFGPGCLLATQTHAKFALITNEQWAICIRASMNLTRNPRFEQFDLDDDPAICAFFFAHHDEIRALTPAGLEVAVAEAATGYHAVDFGMVEDAASEAGVAPGPDVGGGAAAAEPEGRLVTVREFAEARGVVPAAVYKALNAGRIRAHSLNADGVQMLDAVAANREWDGSLRPRNTATEVVDPATGKKMTLHTLKILLEAEKVRDRRLRNDEKEEVLVHRDAVAFRWGRIAAIQRDAMVALPDAVVPHLVAGALEQAGEGADRDALRIFLERTARSLLTRGIADAMALAADAVLAESDDGARVG